MPDTHLAIIRFVLQTLKAAPTLTEKLRSARGRPSAKDRDELVAYCRRLDERRVFRAPFRDEIAESCLASLSQVKEFTDATLARLSHPTAQAALGAILDEVRSFLDTWEGTRTPHEPFERRAHHHSRRDGDFSRFLQDLGALREKLRVLVGMLELLEPKATALRLREDSERATGAE